MRTPAESHFASHSGWFPCTTSTPPEGLDSPPPTTSSKWWSRDIRECCAATFGECPNHLETTWLNNHDLDAFFVGTCNDASQLPPEFARAERFDGVFFVDLPGRDQKDTIWGIYTRHCGLDAKQARPDDTNWTGAEMKSCGRLASLLDLPLVQAAQNVVAVAVTAGDKIESLRQWGSGRCLSADPAGVFSRSEGASGGRVRRVVREPGVN